MLPLDVTRYYLELSWDTFSNVINLFNFMIEFYFIFLFKYFFSNKRMIPGNVVSNNNTLKSHGSGERLP